MKPQKTSPCPVPSSKDKSRKHFDGFGGQPNLARCRYPIRAPRQTRFVAVQMDVYTSVACVTPPVFMPFFVGGQDILMVAVYEKCAADIGRVLACVSPGMKAIWKGIAWRLPPRFSVWPSLFILVAFMSLCLCLLHHRIKAGTAFPHFRGPMLWDCGNCHWNES